MILIYLMIMLNKNMKDNKNNPFLKNKKKPMKLMKSMIIYKKDLLQYKKLIKMNHYKLTSNQKTIKLIYRIMI